MAQIFALELKVLRTVPDEYLQQPMRNLFQRLVRVGATLAAHRAPVDHGHLRRSTQPQQASVQVDSARVPKWALYGPKVLQPPYPGYLNAGTAKSVTGKRYSYHYRGGPRSGQLTAGWFTVGVVQDLETSRDVPMVAQKLGEEIAAGWNGR
jgi:hypothetical protein